MKKALLLMMLSISLSGIMAQTGAPATNLITTGKPEVLILKETGHNFGKIPQGRPATYNFEIINTGTVPLSLENVQASCGCTTPEWSKEPIGPGAKAVIKVGYNAYAEGPFTKNVTIFYNNNQTKVLSITGEVYKAPPTSVPENASVQFLKQTNQ